MIAIDEVMGGGVARTYVLVLYYETGYQGVASRRSIA